MDIDTVDDDCESRSENEIAQPTLHSGVLPIRGSIPIHGKRQIESSVVSVGSPPRKRMRGDFNAAYLNLLNCDINDISSGLFHGKKEEDADTQIGTVVWSSAEKAAFFAAVSRLGKADHAGISTRIGTKSELEVRQYLVLLDATEGKGIRQNSLRPVDIPAAVEIGAECGAALEAAADALSLRQESYEEQVEIDRWGSIWRVTVPLMETFKSQRQGNSEILKLQSQPRERGLEKEQRRDEEDRGEKPQPEDEEQEKKRRRLEELPFLQLFCVENWLQLSDRIFMNSTVSDCNWRSASEEYEPPAIRMTALSDFYGLVFSVTRRLLFAAMYVAESRVRRNSFEVVQRRRKTEIRVEDVRAAASSLSMKQNSGEFWAQCARRLRLDVVYEETEDNLTDQEYEDSRTHSGEEMDGDDRLLSTVESESGSTEESRQSVEENEDDDGEIMSYDEVEAALGYPVIAGMHSRCGTPKPGAATTTDISSNSVDEIDEGEQYQGGYLEEDEEQDEYEGDTKMEDQQEPTDSLNLAAIKLDLEEATISLEFIDHTVVGANATRVIKSQIQAEHRLERDAELLDVKARVEAEKELWAVLYGNGDMGTIDNRH
ncbi:hypothetical protein F4803DRAFT_506049 [Xylaria telfairii]|nr:hypothetical protein F4803DRAFT_506049 [Xylaria telfairii]